MAKENETIDAAHKREIDGLKKQVGSAAKLRDALVQVQKKINYLIGNLTVPNSLVANRMEINGIINAALAAPPRNCDRFNSGNAERDAEMAWDAITSGMDLQFSDLTEREIAIIKEAMRGFVWLFTTADESEAQA